jgi:glycosyltransferase involved in cell wall biosynthesis
MNAIHAIILTLNEECHIARCIASIKNVCATITVIDSGSTDRTVEIAETCGARVISNPFVNHATQVNFAIEAISGSGGWVMRIDADEVLTPESGAVLARTVAVALPHVDGILMKRKIVFMGRVMQWGGMGSVWSLRVWREGRGQCECRWMDEHIIVPGKTQKCDAVIEDRNKNSLDWWTLKHNSYASREAMDLVNTKYKLLRHETPLAPSTPQAARKRAIKTKIYSRLPGPLRTSAYFFYRYVARLGFLDGKAGFYFHLFQGLWYRSLVDAKISDIEAFAKEQQVALPDAIKARTGFDILRTQKVLSPVSQSAAPEDRIPKNPGDSDKVPAKSALT